MQYRYDPESDTLTISLKEVGPGDVADSDETVHGLVTDYSKIGEIIQFELRNVRGIVNSASTVLRKAA
jgi:uncharacterized protein YuzE